MNTILFPGLNASSGRGQLGPFSCPKALSCMISNLDKTDSKLLVLCREWPPWSLWVPPLRPRSSGQSLLCLFVVFLPRCDSPAPIPLFLRATCQRLKSSLSENASLGFILIASPATSHISSCFNLGGGGGRNEERPVTGHQFLYVGTP